MYILKLGKLYISDIDYTIDSQGGLMIFGVDVSNDINKALKIEKSLANSISKYSGAEILSVELKTHKNKIFNFRRN